MGISESLSLSLYLLFIYLQKTETMAALPADLVNVYTVCGITTAALRNRVAANEGLTSLEAFAEMENDQDVDNMAKRLATRPAASRVNLSTVQIKRLQVLVWWLRDRLNHGLELDGDAFTEAELALAKERKFVAGATKDSAVPVTSLKKFVPEEFDVAEDAFKNICSSTIGLGGGNIRYVIRDQEAPADFADGEEERMYQMRLEGTVFEADNRKVYQLLKAYLVETPGYVWIESFDATQNGRGAFQAWTQHYNGTGELSKRMQRAKTNLKRLHYKSEHSMSFERFNEKMSSAFKIS